MNYNSYTLITGASGGIGYELALLAASDNKNLVLVARSSDKLHEIADAIRTKYKVEVKPFTADLSTKKMC